MGSERGGRESKSVIKKREKHEVKEERESNKERREEKRQRDKKGEGKEEKLEREKIIIRESEREIRERRSQEREARVQAKCLKAANGGERRNITSMVSLDINQVVTSLFRFNLGDPGGPYFKYVPSRTGGNRR